MVPPSAGSVRVRAAIAHHCSAVIATRTLRRFPENSPRKYGLAHRQACVTQTTKRTNARAPAPTDRITLYSRR
jgi:hypothetical protein